MVCREIALTTAEGENELTPPLSEDRECEATSRLPRALCKEVSLELITKGAVRPTLNGPLVRKRLDDGMTRQYTAVSKMPDSYGYCNAEYQRS